MELKMTHHPLLTSLREGGKREGEREREGGRERERDR